MTINSESIWTIEDSLHTYQVSRWGEGYFGISDSGNLCVYPTKNPSKKNICISSVIKEAKKEGISFPAVIRFHDVLRSQVKILNETFSQTIKTSGFKGSYQGVYPIKVNQLREVIEEITDIGQEYSYGLEVGSKPELMAALAYNQDPNALTILNGYKDKDYIRLAMLGKKLGRKVIIVVEKFSEIHNILKIAEQFHVKPILGVRAKLSSKSSGKWADSSGDFAKFGLSTNEILDLLEVLKEKDLLDCLQLFHFHVGSQIPDIRTIKECLTEGSRIYANLVDMGVPLKYFDVGGGVGINYDATRSNCPSSTNYTLKDYVGDVVYILKDICDIHKIDHPIIVSETGRAVAAHHSCVITDVFGHVNLTKNKPVEVQLKSDDHLLVKNIKELYQELDFNNYQDIYNDACVVKDEAISGFKLGILSLTERSIVETLYWNICHKILDMTSEEKYVPNEIRKLKTTLADKYLCNFSLFQSAPDTWAIEQILPVVPISHHLEQPNNECTLADITCDSDGKIANFLGPEGNRKTLKIHDISNKDDDYYIGLFLTGAYQDVMGDMHNLFGRLNEIHVYCDEEDPNGFYIEEILHGNTAADVLKIMQYHPLEMCRKVKTAIDKEVKNGNVKPRSGVKLADFYEACLFDYTYLKDGNNKHPL